MAGQWNAGCRRQWSGQWRKADRFAAEQGWRPARGEAETHAAGEIDPAKTIAERVAETSGSATAPQSVRTETYTVQAYPIEVPLRGRTKAKNSVTVTPETSGVVTAVNVTKGQTVKPGDVLCTLDQGDRAAAVAQAEAALAQAQTQFDTNAELREEGPRGRQHGQPVRSRAQERAVGSSTTPRPNSAAPTWSPRWPAWCRIRWRASATCCRRSQPCATVVELDPMLFIGTVPEARIALAKTRPQGSVTTITGQTVEGKVSYIASIADDATRSFPVEIEIPNADGKVLSGVTATATVSMGTAAGASAAAVGADARR